MTDDASDALFMAALGSKIHSDIERIIVDDMIKSMGLDPSTIANATTARNTAAEVREMHETMMKHQKKDAEPIPEWAQKKGAIVVESEVIRLTKDESSAIVISNTLKQ